MFDAPPVLDETDSLFKTLSSEEKEQDLFWNLNSTRIRWTATLKSEDSFWKEMLHVEQTLLSAETAQRGVSAPLDMMAMGGPPPESTNNLWLEIDEEELALYAPETFTNVEVFAADSLSPSAWTLTATGLSFAQTNPVTLGIGGSDVQFYRACTWADTDLDGLSSGQETYVYQTDPLDSDSDNDTLTDGEEILTYGLDPLDLDTDGDQMPDGWEVENGLDALDPLDAALDTDGDGLLNLEEYIAGTKPDEAGEFSPGVFEVVFFQPEGI